MISLALKDQVYNCIKCGLCMNSCPVYRQLHFEGVSPRGKVQLIKKILEGKLDISEYFCHLLETCLLCESCSVNCPSGVKLDSLMKAMRAEAINKFNLSWQKRALNRLLSDSCWLPFAMFWGRRLETPLRLLMSNHGKLGTIPLARLPRLNTTPLINQYPEIIPPIGHQVGRVLYFIGCATNYVSENVGHSVISILSKLGVEVIIPKNQMCCGFSICLTGARKPALKNIRHNLQALNPGDADAIIIDCPTCGAALKKEYPNVLDELGEDARIAKDLSSKVLDISQYVAGFEFSKSLRSVPARVTYHDPCHLLHTLRVKEEPRRLLRSIPGVDFVEMTGADNCCGGGGTFQVERPEVASGITKDKIQAIISTRADIIATGCPGCRLQIQGHLEDNHIQVLHPLEILAKAMT